MSERDDDDDEASRSDGGRRSGARQKYLRAPARQANHLLRTQIVCDSISALEERKGPIGEPTNSPK
jgi:hypothetical protein